MTPSQPPPVSPHRRYVFGPLLRCNGTKGCEPELCTGHRDTCVITGCRRSSFGVVRIVTQHGETWYYPCTDHIQAIARIAAAEGGTAWKQTAHLHHDRWAKVTAPQPEGTVPLPLDE